MGRPNRPEPHASPWIARLAGWLVALAVAMGGNLVSTDIAATMVSTTVAGFAVVVAALATLGATLIRSDPADRLALLCGVVLIAMGVGLIANGTSAEEMTGEGRFFTIAQGGLITQFGIASMGQGRTFVDLVTFAIRVLLDDQIPDVLPARRILRGHGRARPCWVRPRAVWA